MISTARLDLPLIASEQAQKHVTHNEALLLLDAIVQLRLDGLAETVAPAEPEEGATYGIGVGATGAWEGRDGAVAVWTEAGWRFAVPAEGWLGWDKAAGRPVVYRGGTWRPLLSTLDELGIGTAPDAVNRLAVRSEATLFTGVPVGAGGTGDVRLTLNKETPGDSATLLFQSDWAGRAEIGLAGNDDFAFKVSADGIGFTTAMTLEAETGFVRFSRFSGCAPSFPIIAGGVLTAETGYVVPAPESGTSDEIDTIEGGFDGAVLIVTGTAGRTLTCRDGAGNLKLKGNRMLNAPEDSLMLVRRGADWIELSFSDNG